jgi:hypothetical protein
MNDASSRHFDGGDGRFRAPPISDALRAALRTLHDELEGGTFGPAMDVILDDVLSRVATQARDDGLDPEHLLIAFRQLWDAEDRPLMSRKLPSDRDKVRWRLVSALVSRYYADTDGATPGKLEA